MSKKNMSKKNMSKNGMIGSGLKRTCGVGVLLLCGALILGGCGAPQKDPAEDIVKDFGEKVDAFLAEETEENRNMDVAEDLGEDAGDFGEDSGEDFGENPEEDQNADADGPVYLGSAYTDYVAKITTPERFQLYDETTSYFADMYETFGNDSFMFVEKNNNDTEIFFRFTEYDPLEDAMDTEYKENAEEYSQVEASDVVEKEINGQKYRIGKVTYLFNGESYGVDAIAVAQLCEFEYFCCDLSYLSYEEPWFGDTIMEEVVENAELYQTGEEPRAIYEWNQEVTPDENGNYLLKAYSNTGVRALIAVPNGYEYQDSDVSSVTFEKSGNSENQCYITYSAAEERYLLPFDAQYENHSNSEYGYTDSQRSGVQTVEIMGYEIEYERIDALYNDTIHETEYLAKVPIENGYLQLHFSYAGEDEAEVDDAVLEEMMQYVVGEGGVLK